jgi:hypothetical protein
MHVKKLQLFVAVQALPNRMAGLMARGVSLPKTPHRCIRPVLARNPAWLRVPKRAWKDRLCSPSIRAGKQ